ncbi:metacaspase-1-like isoform X2 [Gossypium arboreum]|uniref:metacaspase-1-like isoform X2 n=1 Tax=Gossypium arboreum TaxID=29729 RepID=UPI0022F1724D|nr:metacaspase-1-like isoform X2 [Gossypium arboreum]
MIFQIVCHRCRQKLTAPAYAEKITCPHCGQVNPIIKKPSPVISDEMIIKIVCHRCRQKLTAPAYAEKITCPHCGQVNPIIKKPSPVTSRDQGKISPPLICKPMEKLKRLLLGNTQRLSDSSGSSSSPPSKLCSLDYCGNHPAKKRAVLCGVSYKKGKYKLEGPINDVMNMKTLLTQTYGFPERNILVLTEEESDIRLIPTKANIETCLKWLVNDCQKGDSLVFFYSGHGSQQPDFNQDERDGFDETICPVNFLREGMIVDNDIYATIVKPLSEGVTLHAIVDACHSGTILDLEHVYERDKRMWVDNSPPSGVRKKTSGGIAYSISACEDYQVAADTSALNSNTVNGAMTYILIDVVRCNPNITYGDLLDQIETRIEDANQQGCFGGSRILSKLFGPNLTQKPVLSASEEFPVYERKFRL